MEFLRPGARVELEEHFGDEVYTVLERVVDYMASAPVVLSAPTLAESDDATPAAFRCDGIWIWTESAVVAVRDGKVSVPVDFAERVLASGAAHVSLSADERAEALVEIQRFKS